MERRAPLTDAERKRAKRMILEQRTLSDIARALNCSRQTISRLKQKEGLSAVRAVGGHDDSGAAGAEVAAMAKLRRQKRAMTMHAIFESRAGKILRAELGEAEYKMLTKDADGVEYGEGFDFIPAFHLRAEVTALKALHDSISAVDATLDEQTPSAAEDVRVRLQTAREAARLAKAFPDMSADDVAQEIAKRV